MPQGRVEWFSDARGFGLLREEVSGREYYVICDALEGGLVTLEPGLQVSFEPGRRGEADVALRVRPSKGQAG